LLLCLDCREPPTAPTCSPEVLRAIGYGAAILVGVVLVPEIAAFAHLAVAAPAEGERRLTFAPLGGD
jgi:hypothetical protein